MSLFAGDIDIVYTLSFYHLNFLYSVSDILSCQVFFFGGGGIDQVEGIIICSILLVDLQFELGMVIKTANWIIHNRENFNNLSNDES